MIPIVVDDGSSDSTADIARRHGARVFRHITNLGVGAATITGLMAAKALGADVIVIGWVQKVSNLILNINLQVKDVRTGEMLYAKSVDLRSNTDDSWLRGIRHLLTNMAEENH